MYRLIYLCIRLFISFFIAFYHIGCVFFILPSLIWDNPGIYRSHSFLQPGKKKLNYFFTQLVKNG